MLSENPKVTICIPTKNRASSLPTMLDSLTKQTYKNFEVVIADGGSTDGTKNVVDNYKDKLDIKFFVETGGLVKQENEGIRRATGEIWIRTDDDAEYSSNAIEEIVKTFQMDDKIGGVSAPTITPDMKSRDLFLFQERLKHGNIFWRLVGKFYYGYILEGKVMEIGKFLKSGAVSLGANYPHALELTAPIEVDMHECTSMAVRTDLLRQVGGFDEIVYGKLGEYAEMDVSFKLREAGYKIMLTPKARVHHYTSKEGVFSARANSYSRITNYINFMFQHLHPLSSLDHFSRFLAYLLFQNAYYTYMFLQQGKIGFLGCWPGSVIGIAKNLVSPTQVHNKPLE